MREVRRNEMKLLRLLLTLVLFLPALTLAGPLFADSKHATKQDAQTMATKAADFLSKEGPDKAFAAFNTGGDWRKGDLYVFVIDKTGTWRANGARPELIGKNELNTPDANGKLFIKDIVGIGKSGWVDYRFKSPEDNQDHDKSSYLVHVGDYLVGAGAYKY
jgi:signal transduction histidine kinase